MKGFKLSDNYDTLLGQAKALYALYESANSQRLHWHKKYVESQLTTKEEVHRQLNAERETNHRLTQLLEATEAELEAFKQ